MGTDEDITWQAEPDPEWEGVVVYDASVVEPTIDHSFWIYFSVAMIALSSFALGFAACALLVML